MNKEDLADRICAIAYPCRIHKDLFQVAKGSGLVIVYGASDSMGSGSGGLFKGSIEEEMPGFHEVRALSLHLYHKAGRDGQKIAGHASESMTRTTRRITRISCGRKQSPT